MDTSPGSNKPKEELLKIAEALFAERGFEGTSIRSIVEVAGLNPAMISYHFGSKGALYESIFEARMGALATELEKVSLRPLKSDAMLTAFLRCYAENIVRHPDFHCILSRELTMRSLVSVEQIINREIKRIFHLLKCIVVTGMTEGVFRSIDADLFAQGIFMLLPSVLTNNSIASRILLNRPDLYPDIKSLPETVTRYCLTLLEKE